MTEKPGIDALLAVMARLRDPDGGCPWDLEQNFKTIAPYTIEEAYEVADAIEQDDMAALKDELGDLLLQVVYHAQMAQEAGHFNFDDVARGVTAKMIHRHPHVFGDAEAKSAGDVNILWEERKDKESKRQQAESILDDVTRTLPALMRAQKLQKRAARVGFEWDEPAKVLDKLEEETGEMRQALKDGRTAEIKDELGDLFFVLTNFGRMLDLDCEDVLRQGNSKFERRFKYIERELKLKNKAWADTNLDEMEALWQDAKKLEKPKTAA
jgi:MazG family protein